MSKGGGSWEEDRHGEEGRCAQGSVGVGEEHGQEWDKAHVRNEQRQHGRKWVKGKHRSHEGAEVPESWAPETWGCSAEDKVMSWNVGSGSRYRERGRHWWRHLWEQMKMKWVILVILEAWDIGHTLQSRRAEWKWGMERFGGSKCYRGWEMQGEAGYINGQWTSQISQLFSNHEHGSFALLLSAPTENNSHAGSKFNCSWGPSTEEEKQTLADYLSRSQVKVWALLWL